MSRAKRVRKAKAAKKRARQEVLRMKRIVRSAQILDRDFIPFYARAPFIDVVGEEVPE